MKRFLFLLSVTIALFSCTGNTSKKQLATGNKPADITEVLYFHGKQRCATCNAIEQLTKEVVDSLANEKILLTVIDISDEDNEAIADKYEVTWSSLILDRNGKNENLTDMGFSYAKSQPDVFKLKLTEAINKIAK